MLTDTEMLGGSSWAALQVVERTTMTRPRALRSSKACQQPHYPMWPSECRPSCLSVAHFVTPLLARVYLTLLRLLSLFSCVSAPFPLPSTCLLLLDVVFPIPTAPNLTQNKGGHVNSRQQTTDMPIFTLPCGTLLCALTMDQLTRDHITGQARMHPRRTMRRGRPTTKGFPSRAPRMPRRA